MSKRIIASVVGTIAILATALPLLYAFEILKDFKNPDVSFWPNVLGEFFMCSIAFTGLWMGARFLRFASTGRSQQSRSWVRPILLGIGFFFPGFVFSLPLTMVWARLTWPGDGQSVFAAMEVSVYIGIAAAVICCIVLLKKRDVQHAS